MLGIAYVVLSYLLTQLSYVKTEGSRLTVDIPNNVLL